MAFLFILHPRNSLQQDSHNLWQYLDNKIFLVTNLYNQFVIYILDDLQDASYIIPCLQVTTPWLQK